jgi:hypothetical protein
MTTILTDAERTTLVATLNRLVPARDDLPGAGDLGVAATIEQAMQQSPPLRRALLDTLRAIDFASGDHAFTNQPADTRDSILRTVETSHPDPFALLVEHTYRSYYTLPVVQRALGLTGEPPQPRGYHLAPFDPALLAKQRQRPPFWRRTDPEGQ